MSQEHLSGNGKATSNDSAGSSRQSCFCFGFASDTGTIVGTICNKGDGTDGGALICEGAVKMEMHFDMRRIRVEHMRCFDWLKAAIFDLQVHFETVSAAPGSVSSNFVAVVPGLSPNQRYMCQAKAPRERESYKSTAMTKADERNRL